MVLFSVGSVFFIGSGVLVVVLVLVIIIIGGVDGCVLGIVFSRFCLICVVLIVERWVSRLVF